MREKNINSRFVCVFRLNGFYLLGIRGTKARGCEEDRLARLRRTYRESKHSHTYKVEEGRKSRHPLLPDASLFPHIRVRQNAKSILFFPSPISSLMVLQKASGQASRGPCNGKEGEKRNRGEKETGKKNMLGMWFKKLLPEQARCSQLSLS